MGNFHWHMVHTDRLRGRSGEDPPFKFDVPPGEQFLSASIGWSVQNFNEQKGALIQSQPAVGATGSQQIVVHWWFDGPWTPGGTGSISYSLTATTGNPGKIIVFEHIDFGGRHVLLDLPCANLSSYGFNDTVSSLVILQGNWKFYKDKDFNAPYLKNGSPLVLPPGLYPSVVNVGITNDDLTALEAVTDPPNT